MLPMYCKRWILFSNFLLLWPKYEKLVVICLAIHTSALWWGLTALKFSFTWIRHKGPTRTPPPQIIKNKIFVHFGSCMKNWFSNCFPLLYICPQCDEVCICWHFGAPDTPGFYVRAQHDPEQNKKSFYLFLFWNSKGFYHIASIFDM